MEYTKLEKEHYNLHIIQTDRFKTINVKVNFKRKLVKEEITKRNMLVNALFESTANYPTKRLLEIKSEDLYDLSYHGSNYESGIYTILSFDMTFINPKYTEEGMDDASFELLEEFLYHPNVSNGAFVKENYDIAYHNLSDYLTTLDENVRTYAQIRMLEEMGDGIYSYRSSGYMEDLEKLTSKDLYEYYCDVINNDIADVFVIGEVDVNRIESLVQKHLVFKNNIKSKDSHFYLHPEVNDEIKLKIEKTTKEQSTLMLGFRLDPLTDYERRYVLSVYNYILGGSTESNLFQVVREDHSLCYYINSSNQPLLSIGIIRAGINAADYDETLSLINQELNKMKTGDFDDAKLNNAKETYLSSLEELEDNPESIVAMYTAIEYLNADTISERRKKIMQVTKDEVVAISSKIHLNTVFLLEGIDANEEE